MTATPTSPAEAAAFTILCVDDEPNILSALRRLFRPQGYTVRVAGGGAEGLTVRGDLEPRAAVQAARGPRAVRALRRLGIRGDREAEQRLQLGAHRRARAVGATGRGPRFRP